MRGQPEALLRRREQRDVELAEHVADHAVERHGLETLGASPTLRTSTPKPRREVWLCALHSGERLLGDAACCRGKTSGMRDNDEADETTNDETERESLGRRNLLRLGGVAAAGAAAGAIAAAVNASPAAADDGDPMIAGDPNDAGTAETGLTSTSTTTTLRLENTGTGSAIVALGSNASTDPALVQATTTGTGRVITAIIDNAGSTQDAIAAWTTGAGHAIHGLSLNDNAGVFGEASADGPGVRGTTLATAIGPGVLGDSNQGSAPGVRAVGRSVPASTGVGAGNAAALDVRGRAAFTRSGLLTIPAGANNAFTALVPGGLFTTSRVLATIQENKGTVTVRAAIPITGLGANKGKIQIILTGPVPASPAGGLKVAWFVFG
jgi:hypothetical protein